MTALTLAEALARVASSVFEPEPPRNCVLRFRAWYNVEMARHTLAVDVVDDGVSRYGASVASTRRPEWWTAARQVDRVEDIPAAAAELVAAILRKQLGLGE